MRSAGKMRRRCDGIHEACRFSDQRRSGDMQGIPGTGCARSGRSAQTERHRSRSSKSTTFAKTDRYRSKILYPDFVVRQDLKKQSRPLKQEEAGGKQKENTSALSIGEKIRKVQTCFCFRIILRPFRCDDGLRQKALYVGAAVFIGYLAAGFEDL